MKTKLIAALLSCVIALPNIGRAASQDECAIWLCLPFGFAVPGCDSAFEAMLKRVAKFKNPMPSFGSCTADGTNPTNLDVKFGTAILFSNNRGGLGRIKLGGFCNFRDSGPEEPAGCIKTLNTYEVTEHGVPLEDGRIYVRDKTGNDYFYDREADKYTRVR